MRNGLLAHAPVEEGLLDAVYPKLKEAEAAGALLAGEQVDEAMAELFLGLQAHRLRAGDQDWEEYVGRCLAHPLCGLLHQDPFTARAFRKPRGYAGDARLLDFIYAREEQWPIPEGTSALGQLVFNYTTAAPAAEGVRARREFIANLLDDLADEMARPTVLSVAAGHLREVLLSAAVKRRKLGRYLALDADKDSLEEVKRAYGYYGVEVLAASVRQVLSGRVQLPPFDLVYSTGLYDYLPQATAQQLTRNLFALVRPRGRLVVANFLPGIRDIGYMESYMGWRLVYRTRLEMLDVAALIPEAEVRDIRLFSEENRNILFLQVTRR
jgi:hypothetical protein